MKRGRMRRYQDVAMNEQDNLPKQVGRYEIKRLLGAGAMGSVYLAEDPRIKRKLAIKVVKLDAIRNEADRNEFLARFQREAEVSGVLNDPGIVTIYDVGDSEAGPFLAMEYVAGKPLDSLIKSGEMAKMPLRAKLQIAAGVAAALDHAHTHGIVHRDVKPGNVMLTEEGRPKLMDFGIAKREDASLTQTGTFLGTPSYASPEQIKEGHATLRSDIFSFGVMVFEMLSGVLPFPGTSINTILYRIVNEPPLDVKPPVVGLLPERWQSIFSRVLSKDPSGRYPSCASFLRDLLDAAVDLDKNDRLELVGVLKAGPGAVAPPVLQRAHDETMFMPAEKPASRRSWPKVAGILLVAAALGGGAWWLFRGTGTRTMTVATVPSQARVLRGGQELGTTPLPVPLKAGDQLVVERPGYLPQTVTFDGTALPTLELKPRITEEMLRTTPEGATVVMDGQTLPGVTPMPVAAWDQSRKHEVTFTKGDLTLPVTFLEGEAPGAQWYTLVSAQEAALTGEVKTVDATTPGILRIAAEYAVRVRSESQDYGEVAPGGKLSLPPGTHRLKLSSPKVFYAETRTVTIQPGQAASLALPGLVNLTVETYPSSGIVVINGISTGVESDGGTPIRVVKGAHRVTIQGKSGGAQAVDLSGDKHLKFKV